MTTSLDKKIVLITGASSGIGKACANTLAAQGAHLILLARRLDKLEELSKTLKKNYDIDVLPVKLDVRHQEAVLTFHESLPEKWQAIDVLINNAGLALGMDPIHHANLVNWDTMIDTNVKGLLYISHVVLPTMVKRGQGHVVNIGSVAGQDCYVNGNVYCATKHAVRAITKSMRLDLVGTGIRITEIAPGAVETEFSIVRLNDLKKANEFYQGFKPLTGEDIADAVLYALTRPPHIDVAEMTIFPTAQASCSIINKRENT